MPIWLAVIACGLGGPTEAEVAADWARVQTLAATEGCAEVEPALLKAAGLVRRLDRNLLEDGTAADLPTEAFDAHDDLMTWHRSNPKRAERIWGDGVLAVLNLGRASLVAHPEPETARAVSHLAWSLDRCGGLVQSMVAVALLERVVEVGPDAAADYRPLGPIDGVMAREMLQLIAMSGGALPAQQVSAAQVRELKVFFSGWLLAEDDRELWERLPAAVDDLPRSPLVRTAVTGIRGPLKDLHEERAPWAR